MDDQPNRVRERVQCCRIIFCRIIPMLKVETHTHTHTHTQTANLSTNDKPWHAPCCVQAAELMTADDAAVCLLVAS